MTNGFLRLVGLVAAWAFIYALPAFPIEGLSNVGIDFSFTHAVDMWPMELGLPGLIAGLFFAVLLVVTGNFRRFESLSAARLVGLGALAGLLVGCLYLSTVWPEPTSVVAVIFGLAVPLGALAGPGSALVFRVLARRRHAPASVRA
jgi:hypothetical protein